MKKIIHADPAVISADTFAPEAPISWTRDPDEWLTSEDIENVMRQYEDKFPTFEFLGPSPSDYNAPKLAGVCVWEELCHFSLKKYMDLGTNKISTRTRTLKKDLTGCHCSSTLIPKTTTYSFLTARVIARKKKSGTS
jgi:hypothetical protein